MVDQQAQRGQQWLEQLLKLMGIPAAVQIALQKAQNQEPENYWLIVDESNLSPEQINLLIGEKGETIDSIQYLANTLLNIGTSQESQKYLTVEVDGHRRRRQKELLALAQEAADEVRATGKEVEMEPLSSTERRQIHAFLENFQDLKTESRGQEPERRLVVRPK